MRAGAPHGGPQFSRQWLMVPLCLGATLNPVNSSLIATALLPIAAAMGVAVGDTAVLIAALYIASAVGQPVAGRLVHVCGPRRILLCGTALVMAGGALGAIASSLEALVAARVLVGLGTSTGYPGAMLLIHRHAVATGRSPRRSLGALAISAQVSVTVGVPLGGLLVSLFGWRSVFAVNVPLALLTCVATILLVPPDSERAGLLRSGRFLHELDPVGMLLFIATAWTGVDFLLSLLDPSWLVLLLAVLLLFALTAWESRRPRPFFDVRLMMRNPALIATYARNCGLMLIMYSALFGVSQWLQEVRGMDSERAGLLVVPMTALAAFVSYFASRSARIKLPLVGAAIAATGGSLIMLAMSERTSLAQVVIATTVLGIMVGLSAIANQAALYAQSGEADLGIAAGLLRTSTNVGAILAASAVSFVYAEQVTDGQFHELSGLLVLLGTVLLVGTVVDRAIPLRHASQ